MLLLLLLFISGWGGVIHAELYDTQGPQFIREPSRHNYFTNLQGLLLDCEAKGSPQPAVQWTTQEGQAVRNYAGIREIFPNGTIYFPPFPVSFYRPDVHDQIYVCVASNTVGKILSRNIHVRAVVNQRFDVRVEDAYTGVGSDAVMRCIIPEHVKDFVSVTSWTKDASFNIFPHSGAGGRYFMTPSGELLIEEVSRNDSSSTFRCRTVNRLTGETQLSENAGRLQLAEGSGSKSKSTSPPSIQPTASRLSLKEGEVAVLLCLSQGSPPPTHWWLKGSQNFAGGFELLRPTERVRVRKSAVIIENIGVQDSGLYVCFANSSTGSDRHQIDVVVTSPLSVQVVPSLLTVDIGKSAEFTCWTNSPDESTRQISWRKDGIEIRTSLRLSLTLAGDKLRIANVQREDKGIYQCFVKSDSDMAQASAQLRLGDAAPQFVYRFIEQTLRPGPAVSLKCSAVGNPTPRISWYLDGFSLPHSDRLLIGQYVTLNGDVVSHVNITSTRVEDGGEFKCVASNKLGISSHSARLNIYGPPFVRNMPSSITAIAGRDFRVKCPVAGYPISSITWEKDGQALPLTRRQLVSPDGTLTVKDVDRTVDAGWYSCSATNKQGSTDRKGIQLNIVVPPKIVPFSFPEETKEGERIFATCVVSEGDVPMRLKWLKDMQVVGDTSGEMSSSAGKMSSMGGSSSAATSDISTHRIGDFDALVLQITHVKSLDAGNYTCLAQNSAGQVLHTAKLVVHVPPKIAPFSFPAQVSQGSRVQVVCSVEQADIEETNLRVSWLRDLKPLAASTQVPISMPGATTSTIRVVRVDAFSAMLIIDRADSAHNGNYTCKISNSVEEVSSTVPLVVQVPPKWVSEPKDFEVSEGSPVVIPCQADGFPTPTVSWKKAMGKRPENYRDIPVQSQNNENHHGGASSGSVHLQHQPGGSLTVISLAPEDVFSLPNGSLIIQSAKKAHQGFYLCEASNGIGTGLSKVIRLVINVPVHVKEPAQNVSSRVGAAATLRCEITGDPPILELTWKRGLMNIQPELDSRYRIRTLNSSHGTFTELTVKKVSREDTAKYVCMAGNKHGRSQASIWLYVQEPPDTPRNLHVISKGSRFVRLGWILTQDGNSPIIQFVIKHKVQASLHDFNEVAVPGKSFSETIGNLRPATKYVIAVVAENHVGRSEMSELLETRTDGESPEGHPRNVRVAAVSSTDIQVTWEHPDRDTWHGELLGYYVGFKRYREGEQYQFSTVERRDGLQEYEIKGLHAFTSYEIVVQAYNGIGAGPLSDPVVATTLEDVPSSPPENLHCSPLSSHNLQLSWSPLSLESSRGLVKGYKVFLERTDFDLADTDDRPILKTTSSTNIVVSGLAKYKNYSVQTQAFTVAGDGPLSVPTYCHTEEDLPGEPAAIKSVVSSVSSVTVTWLPPAEPNGVLVKYTVTVAPEAGKSAKDSGSGGKRKKSLSPDTTSFQFDGLRVGEKYEFRVAASTRVGEGAHAISRKTLGPVQSAIISFGQEFRAVWKTDVRLPCDTVGSPFIQWTRHSETVRNTDRISGMADGSLVIRNSRREDSGNYTCTVTGSNGLVLDSIEHKLAVQVPPQGPLLNAAVNSHSSLHVQWKLSDHGGAPVRGYILHFKSGGEWQERQISRHLTAFELKGLQCGTSYQMYLTAFNRAGMGRASELVNISTLGYSPSLSLVAPQFMVETNQSWARVLLRDVWSANGCKIHSFQVLYKSQEASHWQSAGGELDGESHSVDLVGLRGGTSYQVRVIATNSAGSSSAEVTINTPSSGLEAETTNKITIQQEDVPFYLDFRLMLPVILCVVIVVVVATGAFFCVRKKNPVHCRASDILSIGTPSSSTYFKNPRNPQQVYMTVKKSTPLKGVDVTDLDPIPQYADDIYPYATFELNESRRDSKSCTSVSTMDRRKLSNSNHWNHDTMRLEESARLQATGKTPRAVSVNQQESDEYDSCGSDSDGEPSVNRSSFHSGVGCRLNSKFQEHDSHSRQENRYEFAPPSNAMLKSRQMHNEIHGMVLADPYAFNDSYPTVCADDRRFRSGKKSNKRNRSQQRLGSMQDENYRGGSYNNDYEIFESRPHLEPPYEFKDSSNDSSKKPRNVPKAATEFAIAV